jgi:hypothetical protein
VSPEYLAGIIDGEGCVRFACSNYKWHYVRLHVTNTYKPLLDAIQQVHGGKIKVHTKPGHPKGWSPSWIWDTAGSNAERVLRLVLPYLIVKRQTVIDALAQAEAKRAA